MAIKAFLPFTLLGFAFAACTTYSAAPDDAGAEAGVQKDGGTFVPIDGANDDGSVAAEGTFRHVSFAPEACASSAEVCENWPKPAQGTVYLYTAEEMFGGQPRTRTYHVYIPANVPASSPLLIVLHDDGKSGTRMFFDNGDPAGTGVSDWVMLADSRASSVWTPNNSGCRHVPGYIGLGSNYTTNGTMGGLGCSPITAAAVNSKRFILVFPDGLSDTVAGAMKSARHWEDGRVPSPGQKSPLTEANDTSVLRDDVGFIDHVIKTLVGEVGSTSNLPAGVQIDVSRMYVTGHQDGGMMTLRLACEANTHPNLGRVAAFAATGAQLPEPLLGGTQGRPRCGVGTMTPYGLMFMRGTNVATKNCPGADCITTVPGDGVMPFGSLGAMYYVATNQRGRVLSGQDTQNVFRGLFSSFGTPSANGEQVGYYSEVEWNLFGTAVPRIWLYKADGGPSQDMSSRGDWNPYALVWRFVSSFRKTDGILTMENPNWVGGSYTL